MRTADKLPAATWKQLPIRIAMRAPLAACSCRGVDMLQRCLSTAGAAETGLPQTSRRCSTHDLLTHNSSPVPQSYILGMTGAGKAARRTTGLDGLQIRMQVQTFQLNSRRV